MDKMSNQRFDEISQIITAPRGVIGNTQDDARRATLATELLEELTRMRNIFTDASMDDGYGDGGGHLIVTDIERTASNRIYMTINGLFDIQLNKTDEGVVVDIFTVDCANDSLASTYAFDQEALDELEELEEIKEIYE